MSRKTNKCEAPSWAVAVTVILSACVTLPSCNDEPKPLGEADRAVKAAFVPAGYYLPFLIMEHDGLLEKRGYSVSLAQYNDNTHMVNLFLNGHLDVAAQSAMTMFPVEQEHPGLFKFLYAQYNNSYYYVVPKNSPINHLRDLKGKKIGIWRSLTAEAYVKLTLARIGLRYDKEPKDYDFQAFGANDLTAAMENGKVEVLFGFDTQVAKLVSSGNFRYLEEDAINNLMPDGCQVFNGGAFIRTRLITENQRKARAIRDAFFEAIESIRRDPERAKLILLDRVKMDRKLAPDLRLDTFTWPNEQSMTSAERTFGLLKDHNVMTGEINIRGLFWMPRD